MREVVIDQERCKGCRLCVKFCPYNCLKMSSAVNRRGNNYVEVKENVECKGCGICYIVCPDFCIEIYEKNYR